MTPAGRFPGNRLQHGRETPEIEGRFLVHNSKSTNLTGLGGSADGLKTITFKSDSERHTHTILHTISLHK